jgi:pimeloyl-ACP methyl ester carboxylesterase
VTKQLTVLLLMLAASGSAMNAAGAPAATGGAGTESSPAASQPRKSGLIPIAGVRYYYEIHGSGEPILLLHGGFGSTGMFAPMLPALARGRQVIAVDLHGHGRTELGERPIRLADMEDDLAALLRELGLAKVDVLGYSMGGMVAFRLAVQHPEAVRRLALVSAGFSREGFFPELLPMQEAIGAGMVEQMKETPMYQSYISVAPKPGDFPRLLDQMGALIRTPFDWSAEVAKLVGPVMLVYGDSDMYRPEHVIRFYQLLGGGLKDAGWMRESLSPNRLAILPNLTHYDIVDSPALLDAVLPFLNGETAPKFWAQPGDAKK